MMTEDAKTKLDYLKGEVEEEDETASCDCPECSATTAAGHDKNAYWQAAGEFFGYPQCCIDEFIANASQFQGPTGTRKETANYGFIPCERHSREILAGTLTHEQLISEDRLSPLPFASPRWTEPYNTLLLKTTVFALFAKMPKYHIKLAIERAHEEIGGRALLNYKEKWDEYERLKAEQENESTEANTK
jgi:hypothetical protein